MAMHEASKSRTQRRLSGIYGKLPAHGDFIDRGLPLTFIKPWDQWLQDAFAASTEVLGDNWLTTYLTSPIWRFVQSEGVIDDRGWAGILVPSVDSVGRYFPLTIALPLLAFEQPADFLAENTDLFTHWESFAMKALQESLSVDALSEQLNDSAPALAPAAELTGKDTLVKGQAVSMNNPAPWAKLLDAQMSQQDSRYTLWSCTGSSCMAPMLLQTRGLPDPGKYTAMLNGQWQTYSRRKGMN